MRKTPRQTKTVALLQMVMLIVFVVMSTESLAENTDFLKGTIGDATSTIFGEGQKWLYLAEGVGGLYAFHKTKNFFVLFGVIGVAIFISFLKSFLEN